MMEGQPRLVPYDDRWPALFTRFEAKLKAALGARILSVHHVGSTSVPGISAKPILDVLVGVPTLAAAADCVSILEGIGLEFAPEDDIEERLWFRGRGQALRTHHVSLAEPDSAFFRDTLAFRDALRSSPDLARAYEQLKVQLASKHERGTPFHLGKTEFVRRALALKREETG